MRRKQSVNCYYRTVLLLAEEPGASTVSETVSSQTATDEVGHKRATATLSVSMVEGALCTVSTSCKSGTALFGFKGG